MQFSNKVNHRKQVNTLTILSMLVALIVLLGLTPIGMIPLGFCKVTILVIPVAIGTMLLGLKGGLVLGAAFGGVSLISAVLTNPEGNALANALFGASPALGAAVCILPRLAVPVVIGLVHRLLAGRSGTMAQIAASVCGSLTNTVMYLGFMWLCYAQLPTLDVGKVVGVILGVGAIAGTCEAVAAGIICPAIMKALEKVKRV